MVLDRTGIITLLLGVMILARWPVSGTWAIGLFVTIELIVNGWSTIFLALAAKTHQWKEQPSSLLYVGWPGTCGPGVPLGFAHF